MVREPFAVCWVVDRRVYAAFIVPTLGTVVGLRGGRGAVTAGV